MTDVATADQPAEGPEVDGDRPEQTARQAWTVVIVLALLAAAFIAALAFSTQNTTFSVDGTTATTSGGLSEPAGP